jgi:N-acetyl-alpha-D-muramate 1-phosphate uridylyltransferase
MLASSAQIVILAGGLGTRIRSLTGEIPKSLVLIRGKPFIHYQLEWLSQCHIRDVILSIGYLGQMIQDYVGDGSKWGLKVRYAYEGTQPKGTGGALRFVHDQGLMANRFLVSYGDSFLPISFSEVWESFLQRSEFALMTVFKNHGKWDVSNSCFKNDRVTLYQKNAPHPLPLDMQYIDYGLSALRKEIVESYIPVNSSSDLADLFHVLSLENQLAGYETHQRFYEVGSPQGIQDFERFLESPQRTR